VRKIKGNDAGHLYAMKVLKKATLKGLPRYCALSWFDCQHCMAVAMYSVFLNCM